MCSGKWHAGTELPFKRGVRSAFRIGRWLLAIFETLGRTRGGTPKPANEKKKSERGRSDGSSVLNLTSRESEEFYTTGAFTITPSTYLMKFETEEETVPVVCGYTARIIRMQRPANEDVAKYRVSYCENRDGTKLRLVVDSRRQQGTRVLATELHAFDRAPDPVRGRCGNRDFRPRMRRSLGFADGRTYAAMIDRMRSQPRADHSNRWRRQTETLEENTAIFFPRLRGAVRIPADERRSRGAEPWGK